MKILFKADAYFIKDHKRCPNWNVTRKQSSFYCWFDNALFSYSNAESFQRKTHFQIYYVFSGTKNTILFRNKRYYFVSIKIAFDRTIETSDSEANFIKHLKTAILDFRKIYIFFCSQFLPILMIQPPAVTIPLRKGTTSPWHAVPQDIQSRGFCGDGRMETIYLYRQLMKCKKVLLYLFLDDLTDSLSYLLGFVFRESN